MRLKEEAREEMRLAMWPTYDVFSIYKNGEHKTMVAAYHGYDRWGNEVRWRYDYDLARRVIDEKQRTSYLQKIRQ